MANTTFKYATQRDIKDIIPNIDSYDTKEIIRNFSNVTGSVWISYDTGLVTNLFADGEKLEKASVGSANAPNTTTNQVLLDNQADGDSNNYNTLVVADASSFQKGDFIRLQYTSGDTTITEYVQIDGISNNTLTIKRGMLATTPQLITNGANVHLYIRVTENNQWYYDNLSDQLIIYSAPTRSPNDDIVIESGEDYKTYIDRMLSNGAMELNGLLDQSDIISKFKNDGLLVTLNSTKFYCPEFNEQCSDKKTAACEMCDCIEAENCTVTDLGDVKKLLNYNLTDAGTLCYAIDTTFLQEKIPQFVYKI